MFVSCDYRVMTCARTSPSTTHLPTEDRWHEFSANDSAQVEEVVALCWKTPTEPKRRHLEYHLPGFLWCKSPTEEQLEAVKELGVHQALATSIHRSFLSLVVRPGGDLRSIRSLRSSRDALSF